MIEKEQFYPLLFKPVYKQVLWGGSQLKRVLHRTDLPENPAMPVGESWELCDRPDVSSVVENGPLAGTTIRELMNYYGTDLTGSLCTTPFFPLLVKIIDAGKRLSLQVHPDEIACRTLGNGAEPKTEMWYILNAEHNAKIIAGLRPDTTRMKFLETIGSNECEHSLQIFESMPGDAYFIKAGKVHAIGTGNLLLEIQQNSDTTYRISDWGRVGSDGKPRQLHIEQAKQCIDYMDRTVARITAPSNAADHNRKYPVVTNCPYFKVDDLRLVERWNDNTLDRDSFHLISAVNEEIAVSNDNGETRIPAGRTALLPACMGAYIITSPSGKPATVVKTTL